MIFAKKKILVWCDDPPEDPVISIFAGCLANHDRAHSLNNYISKDTLQAVTDRRNSVLEKNVKRVCTSQTTADIEEAMGEGRGDDDEEGESEDENEDVQGTRLADNTLETKRRKRDTDRAVSVTPRIYLPHPATTGSPCRLLCSNRTLVLPVATWMHADRLTPRA